MFLLGEHVKRSVIMKSIIILKQMLRGIKPTTDDVSTGAVDIPGG